MVNLPILKCYLFLKSIFAQPESFSFRLTTYSLSPRWVTKSLMSKLRAMDPDLFLSNVDEKMSLCIPMLLPPYSYLLISKVDEKVSVDPGYLSFATRNC